MSRRLLFLMIATLLVVGTSCRRPAPPQEPSPPPAQAGPPAPIEEAVPKPSQGVVIEFWHTQTMGNAEALNTLVKRFNERQKGQITVRPLYQGGYTDLYRKIMAAIAAKRPPEVAVSYENMVAEYMKAGVVQPLDAYVSGPDGLSKESLADIFPSYLESNRFAEFGNQLLSFPFTKSVLVMFYNQQALSEAGLSGPPKTWEEFRQAVLKTTKRDAQGKVIRYGFGTWADASTIDGCFLSRGASLLSEDRTRVAFRSEPALAHFRLMADLVKQGAVLRTTKQQYAADFGNGRVALIFGSSTAREILAPAVAGKFPWGAAIIPQSHPEKPITVQYGANIAIFKTTYEKQRAAWLFVRWLTEPEQTAYWATHSTYMPLRRSVATRPEMLEYWKKDPQAKQCFEIARYGVREPNVRGWQDVRTALEEAYDKVLSGVMTPEAALAEAEAKANKALREKQ